MKNLTIEAEEKFRKELKANLEGCGICCDSHIRTTWYEEKIRRGYDGRPNITYTDDGERVLINEAIELSLGDSVLEAYKKNIYVDVQFDSVSIWKTNPEKKCFDFVNVFWFEDYKNKTALSMAVACELVSIANRIKED